MEDLRWQEKLYRLHAIFVTANANYTNRIEGARCADNIRRDLQKSLLFLKAVEKELTKWTQVRIRLCCC